MKIRICELDVARKFADIPAPRGLYTENITEELRKITANSSIKNGVMTVQSLHTTLGVAINENESGLLKSDFPEMFGRIAPEWREYMHDNLLLRTENLDPNHPERPNGESHCRALLIPPSLQIIIENGDIVLGRWQSILVFEFDGPRADRKIKICLMGE